MLKNTLITLAAACAALFAAGSAPAQVSLTGFMGDKALIMVNGGPPKVVAVGSTVGGIQILSINKKQHLAEANINGTPTTLRLIGMPSSFGSKQPPIPGATKTDAATGIVTIPIAGDGHFYTDGTVNGQGVKFMIDTGASNVVLGEADAKRLGIPYLDQGRPTQMSTANGSVTAYRITLNSVEIGGITASDVDAVVGSNLPYILLGNSFLSRVKMQRNDDAMMLEKK